MVAMTLSVISTQQTPKDTRQWPLVIGSIFSGRLGPILIMAQ